MFLPKRVIFEESALEYEKGRKLLELFQNEKIEIKYSSSGRITGIPGKSSQDMYGEGKNTLVIGVRKTLKFESCKPSAHYQLPLVSGCMGMCEYCYLNTQMGKRPYTKIHVNIEEILEKAKEYIAERTPQTTIFEGAATSDPIPIEPYSGALKSAIEFFGNEENGLFRFVTKFTEVDSLLDLEHNGRTTIRFSINTNKIISSYEHRTPSFEQRLDAAIKTSKSGYPLGFIIAPVFLYENWETEYLSLLEAIRNNIGTNVMFEIISHRFTKRAKENILSVFPKTSLPMEEELRKFKFGQFGYGKYIYKDEELNYYKKFFKEHISNLFGAESINYII